MHFSADPYLDRQFDMRAFNCWDLLREVWLDVLGVDLGPASAGDLTEAAIRARAGEFEREAGYRRLAAPATPSIALMRHRRAVPHVGFYWRGRVLQIGRTGVSFLPAGALALEFSSVEYYLPWPRS